jgi:hypothetical protein
MIGNRRKGIVLQERDRRVLNEVGVMGVADRELIKCAARFGSTTRANSRLLALTRAGLLRRFFLGTSAGGKKALYALSPHGANLAQVPYRGPRRRTDEVLVADFFVTHKLAINRIYCALAYQPIPIPGAQFVRWMNFSESIAASLALIPDGYFEIATPGKTLSAFLEVDLGHESRSVWRKKVEQYLNLAISGAFDQRFGHSQFRVLAVTNSERRMASLRLATAAITEKIFWFSTLNQIDDKGFWSPVWLRPKGTDPLRLL